MSTVWVFFGKGRSANARAFVRGETEVAARARLLRDDACPYFEIDAMYPFEVLGSSEDSSGGRRASICSNGTGQRAAEATKVPANHADFLDELFRLADVHLLMLGDAQRAPFMQAISALARPLFKDRPREATIDTCPYRTVQKIPCACATPCPLVRDTNEVQQRDAVAALSDDRIEILSSRAGGHCVGAPATRNEERAMAVEIQSRRRRESAQPAIPLRVKLRPRMTEIYRRDIGWYPSATAEDMLIAVYEMGWREALAALPSSCAGEKP